MKSGKVKWFSVTTALILLFTLVWNMSGTFQDIIRITSIFSATAVLPNGSSSWYKEKEHSSVSAPNQSSSSQNSDSSHNSSSFDTSTLPPERPTDVETGDIKTTMLSVTSANTTYDNLHVSNKTGKTIDIENLLGQGLPFRIEETDQPQVLI